MLKRIDEVCELKSGTSLPEEELSEVGYPYIKVSDMNIADNEKYIVTSKNFAKESINVSMIFPKGTVIFPKRGGAIGTNKKRLCDCNICADLNVMGVIPNEEIMSLYLYYYFQKIDLGSLYNGSSVPQINNKDIGPLQIDVPEKSIQEERIERLEKVDGIIRKRKSQLEWLDNLIKSRFVEMFGDPVLNPYGWEQTTLKDVAVGKLSYGSGASAVEFDGACRYVRITDITESGGLNDDVKSPDKYDEKYLLHDGDVLFARSGATVGKTLRYSSEKHGKGIYAGYLIRLVPNTERVLPDYVFYYTKTEYYASFVKKAQRAVAQPNINAQEYGDLIICVPPIELQEKFMAFVNQVDKLKFEVQKSLDETQTLMDSLMQQYFG